MYTIEAPIVKSTIKPVRERETSGIEGKNSYFFTKKKSYFSRGHPTALNSARGAGNILSPTPRQPRLCKSLIQHDKFSNVLEPPEEKKKM